MHELERTRSRCVRFSVSAPALAELEAMVREASARAAATMMDIIELCIADTGFALVVVDGTRTPLLAPAFLEAAQRIFERNLVAVGSADEGLAFRLERPAPDRLEGSLDRDLLAAVLDDGDAAGAAWTRWRARESIDDHPTFGRVAPMLFENLSRLGVDDVDMRRIQGVRRRAWYLYQLLVRDAAEAIVALRESGCDPVLLDELPNAALAAKAGSVRPVRRVDLYVRRSQAERAAVALAELGWTSGGPGVLTERRLERRTWLPFRKESRVLRLHWRPLPQGCSRVVAPPTDDISARVVLHGTEVETESPTTQLLRLWARTGEPDPGHQLHTTCATADLLERYMSQIDWPRLWSDCERLGLVEYGSMYLRALPRRSTFRGAQPCA